MNMQDDAARPALAKALKWEGTNYSGHWARSIAGTYHVKGGFVPVNNVYVGDFWLDLSGERLEGAYSSVEEAKAGAQADLERRIRSALADPVQPNGAPASGAAYQPEIGQALFGQPSQSYAVPQIMEAVLNYISYRLDTVMWNIHQKEYWGPFSNTGNSFKNDVFEAIAYSWGEAEQPYNFAWRDLRISWYKNAWRGLSANMAITPQLASECLEDCIRSLDRMDDEHEAAMIAGEAAEAAWSGRGGASQ